ncbi:MAG: hypothetical protein KDA22_05565, partial [Phycisphaerales bacterium]|nr:hypothetical protein [Phycisphaerales bacterium]
QILALTLWRLLLSAITVLPFVAAVGAVVLVVLHGVDLNYLWTVRPPRFWMGVASAAPPALVGAALFVRLQLRWSAALPMCLRHGHAPRIALRRSTLLTRGSLIRILIVRLLVVAGVLVLGFALEWLLLRIGGSFVKRQWDSMFAAAMTAAVVIIAASAVAAAMLLVEQVLGALVLLVIDRRLEAASTTIADRPRAPATAPAEERSRLRQGALLVVIALAAAFAAASVCGALLASTYEARSIAISAHRGDSLHAPENTMAAFRAALDAGADWIELDVQETADGRIVVIHDTDLKRVANDPRGIWQVGLDELASIDVGSWFGSDFRDERVPTLAEVIDLVRGKATLNIELKFNGHDDRLAERTVAVIQAKDFTDECVITSLSLEGLMQVRRADPLQRTGFIVFDSIGDLARIDVDMLMVRESLATTDFVATAERAGKRVHAWTVNDPASLATLMYRGVQGVITDKPRIMREQRDELLALPDLQRLLLAIHNWLGLKPPVPPREPVL